MQLKNFKVLYEDNHLIAVDKPGSWLVHGDETGDETLADQVKLYIKMRYNKPGAVFLGVIHRLDRPVSGAIVFARTSKALTRMNRLFQERKVEKTYLALTTAAPRAFSEKLTHYLIKDFKTNIVKAFTKKAKAGSWGKKAELEYELLGSIANHHLVKVHPLTGRSHQIRVQLSKVGAPIRGDKKYGAPKKNINGFIHLHSHSLEFIHPVKKEPVKIVAELPREQLWNKFRHLVE